MSVKDRITAHLAEAKKTVFDDLIAKGAKIHNDYRLEKSYKLDLAPAVVDKILTKHGYRMLTHTQTGYPMEKYKMYRDDSFHGGKVTTHMKGGKIWYMVFSFHQNLYD